jgi:hypothetical protein
MKCCRRQKHVEGGIREKREDMENKKKEEENRKS